jgi:hypothetical protein
VLNWYASYTPDISYIEGSHSLVFDGHQYLTYKHAKSIRDSDDVTLAFDTSKRY